MNKQLVFSLIFLIFICGIIVYVILSTPDSVQQDSVSKEQPAKVIARQIDNSVQESNEVQVHFIFIDDRGISTSIGASMVIKDPDSHPLMTLVPINGSIVARLEPGKYLLDVTYDQHFDIKNKDVTVKEEGQEIRIDLMTIYKMEGFVYTINDDPVPGVDVHIQSLTSKNPIQKTAQSNEKGGFFQTDLVAGDRKSVV